MGRSKEEKVIQAVRRLVLWDEPREDVFRNLEANGITGAEAEEFYRLARRERIALLRGEATKRMVWGALLLGLAAWMVLLLGERVTRGRVISLVGAFLFGAWWFVDGVFEYIFAAKKRGSVSD